MQAAGVGGTKLRPLMFPQGETTMRCGACSALLLRVRRGPDGNGTVETGDVDFTSEQNDDGSVDIHVTCRACGTRQDKPLDRNKFN